MRITKAQLKKLIKEELESDDLMDDPMGAAAVLPGRGRAAQQALDALRRALGPQPEEVKQAMSALVDALQAAGYDVTFPRR